MKKFLVWIGLGIIYTALLTPLSVAYIWLINHMPETIDLGYCGLVFLCILLSMGVGGSITPVLNFIDYKTDLLD